MERVRPIKSSEKNGIILNKHLILEVLKFMDEREKIIRLWFDMWLAQQDLGIDDIFWMM